MRTATRPTYVPTFLPVRTSARTMSPVWKPFTRLACLGPVRGKPYLSMRHICRVPEPVAVMSSGTTPWTKRQGGVLLPTQAASIQCVLSSPCVTRLNLVTPALPHSSGSPKACKRWCSSHLTVLTAVASLRVPLASARRRLSTRGLSLRNSLISFVPLAMLQGSQASVRLLTRAVPPLARGWICSICRGRLPFSQ